MKEAIDFVEINTRTRAWNTPRTVHKVHVGGSVSEVCARLVL